MKSCKQSLKMLPLPKGLDYPCRLPTQYLLFLGKWFSMINIILWVPVGKFCITSDFCYLKYQAPFWRGNMFKEDWFNLAMEYHLKYQFLAININGNSSSFLAFHWLLFYVIVLMTRNSCINDETFYFSF